RAVNVADPCAELSSVILGLHPAQRVGSGSGSGNINPRALPLVKEWFCSGRRDGESCRAADRCGLVLWMLRDAGSAGKPYAINRAASAIQIVQRAIGAHGQVHGAGQSRRERRDLISVGWIQLADPRAAEVREEINAGVFRWKLRRGGIVKGAPDDRASLGVGVLEDWIAEIRVGRTAIAFAVRPAKVRSRNAVVDFLPGILPDVIDKYPAGPGLNAKGERVAKAQCPDC